MNESEHELEAKVKYDQLSLETGRPALTGIARSLQEKQVLSRTVESAIVNQHIEPFSDDEEMPPLIAIDA